MRALKLLVFVITVAIVIATAGCTPTATPAPAPEHLIVPGEKIGQWSLNMTIEQLHDALSKPSNVTDWKGDRSKAYEWNGIIAYTLNTRVVMITTDERAYRTARGLGAGSSKTAIDNAYERAGFMMRDVETAMTWLFFANGLVFVFEGTETAIAAGVWHNLP